MSTLRSQRARIAALEKWSASDPVAGTAAARAASPGSLAYWCAKVDPGGVLDDTERLRRADAKRRAHFARLALKSAQARGKKAS